VRPRMPGSRAAVDEESLARLKGPRARCGRAGGRGGAQLWQAAGARLLKHSEGKASSRRLMSESCARAGSPNATRRATRWIGVDADRPPAGIPTDAELNVTPEALIDSVPHHPPLAPVVARLAQAQTDVDLARADKRPDWSVEADYAQRGPAYSNMVSLEFHVSCRSLASIGKTQSSLRSSHGYARRRPSAMTRCACTPQRFT